MEGHYRPKYCNADQRHIVETIIITIAVTLFEGLLTLFGLFCLIKGNAYNQATKVILISSLIGNLIGIVYVGYDISTLHCDKAAYLHLVAASVTLSISHLLLLSVAENDRVFCSKRIRIRSYTSFLVLVWFVSPLSAFFITPNTPCLTQTAMSSMQMFCIVLVIWNHVLRFKKTSKNDRRKDMYRQVFLRPTAQEKRNEKENSPFYLQQKQVHFVFVSYILFTMPWLICELAEGIQEESSLYMHVFTTILYSLSFIFQPILCIYVTKRQRKETKQKSLLWPFSSA